MFLREFQEAYYQIINEGIENDFIKYFNEFLQKHPDELEYLTRHQKELKLKLVELKGTKKLKDIKPEDFLKELTSWMKEDKSYESKKGLENAHKNETFKGNKDIEWINEDDYKKGIGKVRIFRPLTTEGSIEIGQPGKFGKKLAKWCTSANSKTNMFNEHVYDGGMCTHNIIYIIPDAVEDINNTKIALRIAEDGLLDNFENSLNNQKFKKVDLNKLIPSFNLTEKEFYQYIKFKELPELSLAKSLNIDLSLLKNGIYHGSITLTDKVDNDLNILKILEINEITGDFDCSSCDITSLKGCVVKVGGDFNCSFNALTSLKYCPISVGGDFQCEHNEITDLEYYPQSVGGDFHCYENFIENIPKDFKLKLSNCRFDDAVDNTPNYKKLKVEQDKK